MNCFFIFTFSLLAFFPAFAQDTIHIQSKGTHVLSARQKLYFFIPEHNDQTDSIIVLNSKAFYAIQQNRQACSTFVQLYQLYKKNVQEGDSKVQNLIHGYEVIIQTKDSNYTSLLKQYDALQELSTKSMQQTTATIRMCRSSMDSQSTSLAILQHENSMLQKDLKVMKKQHSKQKWSFGLIGLAAGLVIGILLIH